MEPEDFEEVEDPSWEVLRELDDEMFPGLFQLPDACRCSDSPQKKMFCKSRMHKSEDQFKAMFWT